MRRTRSSNHKRWIPLLESVGSSYWFIPTLMALAAVALAVGTIRLDGTVVGDPALPWLYSGGAEGARTVLGALAGSMITVAGVVFSVTVVAMSLASQQFGPMLLRNFMHDRRNQLVLGAFVATFVYCVLVLRSVRGDEDGDGFVPHLSTTVAIVMAIGSVGVLIFFIHHIARSIRVESVLERVAADLEASIDQLFPERVGQPGPDVDLRPIAEQPSASVEADCDGYLVALDDDLLIDCARQHDVCIEVAVRPHDFVVTGATVFGVRPADRHDDELARALRRALVLGTDRTTSQDIRFGLDQLVQLGLRALSPSLNDPLTAKDVIDRVVSAIARIVRRGMPLGLRYDDEGLLRVIAPAVTFAELLERGLEPLRRSAGAEVTVVRHLLVSAPKLGASIRDPAERAALHAFVARTAATASEAMTPTEWKGIEPLARDVLARLVQPRYAESRTSLVISGGAPIRAGGPAVPKPRFT